METSNPLEVVAILSQMSQYASWSHVASIGPGSKKLSISKDSGSSLIGPTNVLGIE